MLTEFWQTLNLKKLSDLSNINNFQDTISLCGMFENRAKEMIKKFPNNPRKCTSASSLSGCVHRYLSKAIIALRAQAEIVELFEETFIGGFICKKLEVGVLFEHSTSKKLTISAKRELIYKTKDEMKNIFNDKRVVTKILKMDEYNQYGNVMTKPLQTGR